MLKHLNARTRSDILVDEAIYLRHTWIVRFSESEFKALATMFGNLAIVAVASVIIPVFSVDKINWQVLLYGLAIFIVNGWLSLYFAKKGKL